MRLRREGAAAVAAVLVLLAGCTPPAAPTPSPTPSFECTPEAGGDAYQCNQQQYDQMVAKDKLYAEAEQVYRKFLAEDTRIMRAGGVTEPTPVLLETTTGAFLEDVMDQYRSLVGDKMKATGASAELVRIARNAGAAKTGSVVSLTTCVDGSGMEFVVGSKILGKGVRALDQNYFGWFDGALKIIGADGEEVDKCIG